jgi:hypothetical protein
VFAHAGPRPADVDLWDAIPKTVALEAAVPGWRSRMSDDMLRFRETWADEFLETQFLAEHDLLQRWELAKIREGAEQDAFEDVIKLRVVEDGLSAAETWRLARFDHEDDAERLRTWTPKSRT